ncbi:MAG: alpha-amylase [Cyclobacteriaceae bacterium]|jgi:alpha-amylase
MRITPLIFVLTIIVGCTVKKEVAPIEKLPNHWPNAVTYEIFVQSFADANGDGIGDLNGLTSQLDYIADLGVEAIWLMPINPSPSYHKYDVTDYYDIHPDYGTMDDFKKLLDEAHQRGLKIIMDLVINHCSSEHPWFQAALNNDEKYRDYFTWATREEIDNENKLEKATTGDSDNIRQWNEVKGEDELYYAFFTGSMPDLNYDNPNVREDVYAIGKYWLTEIGVDGFRLDAAKHIYPDDRAEDNHAFWKEFKETMESYKPEVYLVGEVWADLQTQAPFAQGFSALFNFDMAFSLLETVNKKRVVGATIHEHAWKVLEDQSPLEVYSNSEQAFKKYNPKFLNTTFLTNHDQNRVMSFFENDEQKARLAASILLTLPGTPYLYYGEEIGMKGLKPDPNIREPFLWANDTSLNTSWMKAKYNVQDKFVPLNDQMKDPSSIYHLYRKLIRLRRSSEVLTFGELAPAFLDDDQILSFVRSHNQTELWVIHNLSDQIKSVPYKTEFSKLYHHSAGETNLPKGLIELAPFSTIILSK